MCCIVSEALTEIIIPTRSLLRLRDSVFRQDVHRKPEQHINSCPRVIHNPLLLPNPTRLPTARPSLYSRSDIVPQRVDRACSRSRSGGGFTQTEAPAPSTRSHFSIRALRAKRPPRPSRQSGCEWRSRRSSRRSCRRQSCRSSPPSGWPQQPARPAEPRSPARS